MKPQASVPKGRRPASLTLFASALGASLCGVFSWMLGSPFYLYGIGFFVFSGLVGLWKPGSFRVTGLATGAIVFLVVVAAADLGLGLFQGQGLGERLDTVVVQAEYKTEVEEQMDTHTTCPRWYHKDDADPRGWRRHAVGAGDAPTIAVLGDSVAFAGFAYHLAEAYREAKIPIRVVDTSVQGYTSRDEECVLEEYLSKEAPPSLVLVAVCLNDFTDEVHVNVDLGAGTKAYFWGARYNEQMERLKRVPMLVESDSPWLAANPQVKESFGEELVLDLKDDGTFYKAVQAIGNVEPNIRALLRIGETLRARDIPVVYVLFPVIYGVEPDPTGPLLAHVENRLLAEKEVVVNLKRLFGQFPSSELLHTREAYDVIHYGEGPLIMATHAALRGAEGGWEAPQHEAVLAQIRKRLAGGRGKANMASALEATLRP